MLLRCKTDAARLRGIVLFYKKGARTDTRTAFFKRQGKRNERWHHYKSHHRKQTLFQLFIQCRHKQTGNNSNNTG